MQLITTKDGKINLNSLKQRDTVNTVNLDPITYNDRYPWLDEANYRKLETKIDALGLSGYDREKAMDEAYKQVLPIVQTQIKNSDRRKYINQAKYEASQIQEPSARLQANAKLWVTEITQLIKEKYNIDPSANDEEVFNSWIKTIPDGWQLLANYVNNGDKELLYKWRLEARPEWAKEKLGEGFWSNTWDKMKAEASVPLDAWEKLIYRTGKDLRNIDTKVMDFFADTIPTKSLLEKKLGKKMTDDEYNEIVALAKAKNQETRDINKNKVLDYNRMVNYDYQKWKQELDQDIANYYDKKGYTQLLKEWDISGFFYKWLGDAAQNREMPVIIWATVVNPQMWRTLMAADSYARESEEAFESMLENWASYEQAEKWGAVVWMINAAVEVYLDKILGWVETTTANAIRDSFMKNVQKEVTKKSLGRVWLEVIGNQLKSSAEEWLEEVVQQIVQNAAVKTVNENQGLFDGISQAFEWGFYNPMNVFAWGSNIIENRESIKQSAQNFNEWINSMLWNRVSVWDAKDVANRVQVAPWKIWEVVNNMTTKNEWWNVTVTEDSITQVDSEWDKATFKEDLYSIDPTLKKRLQNNPYSAQVWQKTKNFIEENGRPERANDVAKALIEDVADRVQKKLMEKMDEWGETWKLYKPLDEAWYSVDISELKDWINEMLEDYWIKIIDGKLDFSKTAIDGSEASNIIKIYNWIKNTNAPMSEKEYRTRFRQSMKDMVDFNPNNRDQAWRKMGDTPWDKVIKWIYARANDLAHNQIPELSQLDKAFSEWTEVMDEVSDGLVYKDKSKKWVIKDNITQIIKNLDEPSRRQLVNRLEKLMPGIKEEVSAINQMPKVIDHYYNPSKLQVTIRDKAWWGIWSFFWPVGWLIWNKVWEWASDKIDAAKSKAWDEVLSQTSEEWKAKMKEIQERLEKNKKITQEQAKFLKSISNKLKEWTQKKDAEIIKIIADVSNADETNAIEKLDDAIDRLEIIWAKNEVKELKGWKEEVQKQLNEQAEMDKAKEEFEWQKEKIVNESADQKLPEFKERIYKLQEEEKRIGSVAGKKIWKNFEWKDYKSKQQTEWLRKKDKVIEEIGEWYNVDQEEASNIYDRIERTVSMDDLLKK